MDWITTTELGKFLLAHPDVEYECRLRLGGGLATTHWWYFDSHRQCFQHSLDIAYSRVSPRDFLLQYKEYMWRIEQ